MRPAHFWPDWPEFDATTTQWVAHALEQAKVPVRLSCLDPEVGRFRQMVEGRLGALNGFDYTVLSPSGRLAIVAALAALFPGESDKRVLVPASTWHGCANAVINAGHKPVFVDTAPGGRPMVVEGSKRDQYPQIDCVLAVHNFAMLEDLAEIRRLFPDAKLIEDSAHVVGLDRPTRDPQNAADISIVSFQITKTLTALEGGALLTDCPLLASQARDFIKDHCRKSPCNAPSFIADGAMSAAALGLLYDQIDRHYAQCARRRQGLGIFIGALNPLHWRVIASEASLNAGCLYGLPLQLRDQSRQIDIQGMVNEMFVATGLEVDRYYEPIPQSPFFDGLGEDGMVAIQDFYKPARTLFECCIVLPHQAFLADDLALRECAAWLNGQAERPPDPLVAS